MIPLFVLLFILVVALIAFRRLYRQWQHMDEVERVIGERVKVVSDAEQSALQQQFEKQREFESDVEKI
jgi:membrane protein implicated in regulation of membrane protease activity